MYSLARLGKLDYNPNTMIKESNRKRDITYLEQIKEEPMRGYLKKRDFTNDAPLSYNNYADVIAYEIKKKQMFNYVGKKAPVYKPYDVPVDAYDFMVHKETFKPVPEY
jgi:hypothetical protein